MLSGKKLELDNVRSRDFSLEFLNIILKPATALQKWHREYDINDSFYNSHPRLRNCTREPKLLAFKLNVLHNIMSCKIYLKRGIEESDKCQFCEQNLSNDIIHSLTECNFTASSLFEIFSIIDPNNQFISSLSM